MDLIDLYHAHEHSLITDDYYYKEEQVVKEEKPKVKVKKPKFVPWEPYKAAPSSDRKGEKPQDLPKLIKYNADEKTEEIVTDEGSPKLVDGLKLKKNGRASPVTDEKVQKLEKEVANLSNELNLERNLNQELKNMFLSSIGDDLQCQVEALAGDKIHLGRRLEEYCEKVAMGDEELEGLRIERDVWKCKFMAQTIRADEMARKTEFLLKFLQKSQDYIRSLSSSNPSLSEQFPPEISDFSNLDISRLYERSPCEQRVHHQPPNFSNLTVSCCPGCVGREIKLL